MTAKLQPWTPTEYHTDPDGIRLSASAAHTIISKSPLHAWAAHPKLGNVPRETDRKSFNKGHVVHRLLLGKGAEYIILPYDNFTTKEARQAREAAIDAGKVPITESDFDDCQNAAFSVLKNLKDFDIDITSDSWLREQAITYTVDGVECRSMFDLVNFVTGEAIDLKTDGRSAHPEKLRRKMVDYGYDIQEAAYTDAMTIFNPEIAGRTDFKFVFVETNPPYAVLPVRNSGAMRALGRSKWRRAVSIWKDCLETNYWPGYSDQVVSLDPMPWAMSEIMEDDDE